jgi:hypothetical protein
MNQDTKITFSTLSIAIQTLKEVKRTIVELGCSAYYVEQSIYELELELDELYSLESK